MTTILFNFGMVLIVPQLFLFGLWTMGKIIHLSTTVPRQYAKPEVKPLLNFTVDELMQSSRADCMKTAQGR